MSPIDILIGNNVELISYNSYWLVSSSNNANVIFSDALVSGTFTSNGSNPWIVSTGSGSLLLITLIANSSSVSPNIFSININNIAVGTMTGTLSFLQTIY